MPLLPPPPTPRRWPATSSVESSAWLRSYTGRLSEAPWLTNRRPHRHRAGGGRPVVHRPGHHVRPALQQRERSRKPDRGGHSRTRHAGAAGARRGGRSAPKAEVGGSARPAARPGRAAPAEIVPAGAPALPLPTPVGPTVFHGWISGCLIDRILFWIILIARGPLRLGELSEPSMARGTGVFVRVRVTGRAIRPAIHRISLLLFEERGGRYAGRVC